MGKIKRIASRFRHREKYENVLVCMLRPFVLVVFHPRYAFWKGVSAAKSLPGGFKKIARWSWKTWPRRLVSLALVSLIIVAPLSGLFWQQKIEAAWWNDLWGYRKAITVTNSSGGALTDFQVSFTLDTTDTTKFNNSCADIRVTDYNGDVLPHWVEENNPGCGNAATRIWIKVPSLGTGDSTIYVYYGNPMAVNIASGKNVFEFFDDFNDGNYTSNQAWSEMKILTDKDWVWSVVDQGASKRLKELSNEGGGMLVSTDLGTNTSYMIHADATLNGSGSDNYIGIAFGASDKDNNFIFSYKNPTTNCSGTREYLIQKNNSFVSSNGTVTTFTDLEFHEFKVKVIGNAITAYQDGTQVVTYSNATTIPLKKVGAYTLDNDGGVYYDNFFITKAAATDPTTSTSATEEKSTAPVGYWSFDEGYGTVARDESPNRNNGAITNAVWKPESECLSGKCLYFDGSGDYVTITDPSNGSLDFGTNNFSVSFWMRTKQSTSVNVVNKKESGKGYDISLLDGWGGKTFGRIGDGVNDSYRYASDSYDFYNNKWQHYYAVFDRSKSYPDIYINGTLINGSGGGIVQSSVGDISNAANLIFGNSCQIYLDEVKIYNYARSETQIRADYNAGISGMGKTREGTTVPMGDSSDKWLTDGLIGYWKMDETSGTTVADASGNANTGTLTNAQETGTSDSAPGNTTTTLVDTDGTLSTTDDAYNGMIIRNTSACGSISSGTERIITDYTGATKTFTVGAAWANAPDNCPYEIRHQVAGKFGNGVSMEGVEDDIVVPDSSLWNLGTNDFSVSAWVYFNSYNIANGGHQPIIDFQPSGSGSCILIHDDSEGWKFRHRPVSGESTDIIREAAVSTNLNRWYHVMLTRKDSEWIFYRDGQRLVTGQSDLGILDGSQLRIGNYQDYDTTGDAAMHGRIDETRIYNRALSPDEVQKLYEWAPGPQIYLDFENSSATTAYDKSGNGHDANNEDILSNQAFNNEYVRFPVADTWYKIHDSIQSGSEVVTDYPSDTGTHTRGVDYDIDYSTGRMKILTGGNMSTSSWYYVDSTCTNSGVSFVNGKYGKAAQFDGADDSLKITAASDLKVNGSSTYTFMAWVKKVSTVNADYSSMGIISHNYYNPRLEFTGANNFYHWFRSEDNSDKILNTSPTAYSLNNWYHVAAVWDGTYFKTYVNGSLAAKSADLSAYKIQARQDAYYIGRLQTGVSRGIFNGLIDEAKVYNYARTEKQIIEDMNGGIGKEGGQGLADPIAYYKFDEGVSSTAYNSGIGGTTLNGTLNSGGSGTNDTETKMWDNGGKYGKAIEFDGSNDTVRLEDVLDMGTNDFSLSAWAKTTSTDAANGNGIIYKKSTGQYYHAGYALSIPNGQVRFIIADGTNYKSLIVGSSGQYNDNNWHHIVATAKRGSEMTIYIDGKYVNETAETNVGNIDSSTTFTIGALYTASTVFHPFNGYIDDLKIYNYVLTSDDVLKDYNQSKAMILGSSGSVSGTGSSTNAASGEYCVPGDTTTCSAPVGEWKLDEKVSGDAKTLYDTSGNGNNGTSVDGANNTGMNCDKPGKYGSACEFDGTDDYVSIADSTSLQNLPNSAFSISAWLYILDDGSEGFIFSKAQNSGTNGWYFYLDQFKRLSLTIQRANADLMIQTANGSLPAYQKGWLYVAAVYPGGDEADNVKMYVNGSIISGSVTRQDGDGAYQTDAGHEGRIGRSNWNSYANVKVDQLRLYNYARTSAQIAWEYNKGKPVAHWKFEEGSGTTVHDESGNGYNGTMYNMNSTTDWVTGKFGRALNFNGDDITKINAGMPNNMSSYSVCAWVNPDSLANADNDTEIYLLMRKFLLFFNNSGQLTFRIKTSSVYPEVLSSKNLTTGQWQHVCGVFSGMGYGAQLYLNGENVSTSSRTGNGTLDDDSAITPVIGSATNDYWGNLDGKMDDVRIYNYALSAEQVKQVMNEGFGMSFQ